MSRRLFPCLVVSLVAVCSSQPVRSQDDVPDDPQQAAQRMQEHATPGAPHQLLNHCIGKWRTETRMRGMAPTSGTAEFRWILGNRYVMQEFAGQMMNMPYEGVGLMGYDNYKKKYTSSWADSLSTTMNHSEGIPDGSGQVIQFHGTMDEYLTGIHDKPVKYVLDLSEDDRIVLEVHDLASGPDSRVVEIVYTRLQDDSADAAGAANR